LNFAANIAAKGRISGLALFFIGSACTLCVPGGPRPPDAQPQICVLQLRCLYAGIAEKNWLTAPHLAEKAGMEEQHEY